MVLSRKDLRRNKMGRPVNKKFFGDPASAGYQIAVTAFFTGEGASEPGYIVSQRSNSVYVVESVAGPGTRSESLKLVEGAPSAGEMQVVVTPITGQELTAAQDETDFVGSFDGGTGYTNADSLTLSNGDIVTVDLVAGGVVTEFTITTVNGAASAGETLTATGGTGAGFTLTPEAGNLENTTGTPESARIINQHTVKTFEKNIYNWRAGTGRPFATIGS
jgi:hypothetical protein